MFDLASIAPVSSPGGYYITLSWQSTIYYWRFQA